VVFDEDPGLGRAGTGKTGKQFEIARETGRESGTEQELTDDDVASADTLLDEKSNQPRVCFSEMVNPSVGVDEDHAFFHADRIGRRARGAIPPIFASRSAAWRASSARSPCWTSSVLVTPG